MRQFIFLSMMITFFAGQQTKAQYELLRELKNHTVQVYYSAGHEQRAESITSRVDKAMEYYQKFLGIKPTLTLLILSAADWNHYISSPVVYGMPHYNNDKKLIVAAEDNPFWKSFVPPLEQLPKDLREQIQVVYKNADGSLSMQAFFDLLAIHELGHAFHLQGGLQMQRNWMSELFVNIFLHTYIAENETGLLPALTLFPKMVVRAGAKDFTYTSLKDIHERYNEIARQYPKNYGWYQCRWHAAAAGIYDTAGKQVCRKLWDALKSKTEILTDDQLITFLETNADKSIADMIRNWDQDTVK